MYGKKYEFTTPWYSHWTLLNKEILLMNYEIRQVAYVDIHLQNGLK
jgi:hypothetical protein